MLLEKDKPSTESSLQIFTLLDKFTQPTRPIFSTRTVSLPTMTS